MTPGWRTIQDAAGTHALRVRDTWTLQPGQQQAVRFVKIIPTTTPTEVVKHELTLWQIPIATAQLELTLEQRVASGLAEVDALFTGMGRRGLSYLDGRGGRIARVDYEGTLANANGRFAAAGLAAVTRRKMYLVMVTVISLREVAGQLDADALEVLDSVTIDVPERNHAAEQALVGAWVVPSKTGSRLETYHFGADGTYAYHFESSQSGAIRNGLGEQTAAWGTASQDDERGRFVCRDDLIYFAPMGKVERISTLRMFQESGKMCLQVAGTTFLR